MGEWGSTRRGTRAAVAATVLLSAGMVTAVALGADPAPDPAPPTTTAHKPKAAVKPKTTTSVTKSRPVTTSSRPANASTSSTRTSIRTATTATTARRTTTPVRTRTTRTAAKKRAAVVKKVAVRAHAGAKPRRRAIPKVHPQATPKPIARPAASSSRTVATPEVDVAAGRGGSSELIRTLLLALTVLSLVLALLPWRHVFYPHLGPVQALRVRVA